MKPEQAASMSNAAARAAPILRCTRQAVDGNCMSGVSVATTIKSIWSAVTPAIFIARSAACVARSEVNSFAAQMRRSLMPVRVVIHSSEVSTFFSSSALVSTLTGTYDPTPAIEQVRPWKLNLARGLRNLGLADDVIFQMKAEALQMHHKILSTWRTECRVWLVVRQGYAGGGWKEGKALVRASDLGGDRLIDLVFEISRCDADSV